MGTSIAVPVFVDNEIWGALVATAADEEGLPPGSEQRLTRLTELVAQALINDGARAELAESRTRLLEQGDETRRRLERALHEGAHQHVVALALKLRVAVGRADPASPEAEVLRDVLADAMEASSELSDLARGLHPAVLSERGLAAALQALAARCEVFVNLQALPGRRFPAVVETTAYLMVAEALGNTDRHGEATECNLSASDRGDFLVVEVRDDGVGGARFTPGGGLECISDRGAALGARFTLESPVGAGTVVRLEIPVAT
jgi:signal transduction histidine kinase